MTTAASVARRTTALAAVAAFGLLAAGGADAGTTPPADTTTVFDDPDGRWSATFPAPPERREGSSNGSISYRVDANGDLAAVSSYPEGTFASADRPMSTQAEIFAESFGGGRQVLVNTPTSFGGLPGTVFVIQVVADSGPGTLFGLGFVRDGRVHFVSYLDRQRDSADAGRSFVESYTLILDDGSAAAPTGSQPATPAPAAATTVGGSSWQAGFPAGAVPQRTAGVRSGFGTQLWTAEFDGDGLVAAAAELPAGYELTAAGTASTALEIIGLADAQPGEVARETLGPYAALRFAATAGDATTTVLVAQFETQLVVVAYIDRGNDDAEAAAGFVDSLATP